MEDNRYVILNDDNKIVNVVIWNGDLSTWQPPEKCTYIKESEFDYSLYEWINTNNE